MLRKTKHTLEGLAAAAILTVGTVAVTAPKTIAITEEINGASVKEMATEMVQDDLISLIKPLKVVINSPGGAVTDMELLTAIHTQRLVITELPKFAASAASVIFLEGTDRVMYEDATILFHNVRVFAGGEVFTRFDIKDELDRRAAADPNEKPKAKDPLRALFGGLSKQEILAEVSTERLQKFYEEFLKTDQELRKTILERTGNVAFADKVFNNREDIILNAKEALAEKVATEIVPATETVPFLVKVRQFFLGK